MVKFTIRVGDFKKFLSTVACKGTLQFKSKGKVDSELFSSFYINADKTLQLLTVITIDTFFKQIKQCSTIRATVKEEGNLEITDKSGIDTILSGMDKNSLITITSDGKTIEIENSDGDWYKRRIIGDDSLQEVVDKEATLKAWIDSHSLQLIDGKDLWKITVGSGSALYPMRIKTTKKDLQKFVKDCLNLTKDNDTVIISEGGTIEIHTGKPNSINRSKHVLKHENIGKEYIDFGAKFSALQSIVPNLLDDVILNFRKNNKGLIILRIESFDKNMSQLIALGSQDKDGVLYDEETEATV